MTNTIWGNLPPYLYWLIPAMIVVYLLIYFILKKRKQKTGSQPAYYDTTTLSEDEVANSLPNTKKDSFLKRTRTWIKSKILYSWDKLKIKISDRWEKYKINKSIRTEENKVLKELEKKQKEKEGQEDRDAKKAREEKIRQNNEEKRVRNDELLKIQESEKLNREQEIRNRILLETEEKRLREQQIRTRVSGESREKTARQKREENVRRKGLAIRTTTEIIIIIAGVSIYWFFWQEMFPLTKILLIVFLTLLFFFIHKFLKEIWIKIVSTVLVPQKIMFAKVEENHFLTVRQKGGQFWYFLYDRESVDRDKTRLRDADGNILPEHQFIDDRSNKIPCNILTLAAREAGYYFTGFSWKYEILEYTGRYKTIHTTAEKPEDEGVKPHVEQMQLTRINSYIAIACLGLETTDGQSIGFIFLINLRVDIPYITTYQQAPGEYIRKIEVEIQDICEQYVLGRDFTKARAQSGEILKQIIELNENSRSAAISDMKDLTGCRIIDAERYKVIENVSPEMFKAREAEELARKFKDAIAIELQNAKDRAIIATAEDRELSMIEVSRIQAISELIKEKPEVAQVMIWEKIAESNISILGDLGKMNLNIAHTTPNPKNPNGNPHRKPRTKNDKTQKNNPTKK